MADNALFEPAAGTPTAWPDNRLLAAPPSMADAYEYHAQALQKWMAEQRAAGVAAGTNDPETGWPTQKGIVDAIGQAAQGVMMGTTAPGFRAYHGSPHSFDAFDSAKIGTGEGAQAYGHGLYLADREGVARSYRDQLTAGRPNQAAADAMMEHNAATDALNKLHDKMVQETIATHGNPNAGSGWGDLDVSPHPDVVAKYAPEWAAGVERANSTKAAYEKASMETPKGHMYEVQVNADPAHFLDWDKPLSEQSPHVQQALTPQGLGLKQVGPFGEKGYYGWADESGKRVGPLQTGKPPSYIFDPRETGMSIAKGAGSWKPDYAAEALRKAGIPGIRYLDGGSRADGAGTSNHVIFDADTIAILRKYGIAGLIAGGGAAAAGKEQQ